MATDSGKKSAGPSKSIFSRLGPGIISACVVIGPGSVLTSTQIGAEHGFKLVWVLLIAVILMMVYMTMGARLGAIASESPGDIVSRKAGRWLAIVIGISVFCISSSYQFGNSLGVHSAIKQFVPGLSQTAPTDADASNEQDSSTEESTPPPAYSMLSIGLLVGFNLLAIAFLFAFGDLYRWLERLMMIFVGLMLAAFFINLFFAKPDPAEFVRGFIPSLTAATDVIPVIGWIGTTFITAIAYYQAYLVRQKGWGEAELREGLIDARLGSIILAVITLMIMATAAAVFHQVNGVNIMPTDVADVGQQLRPFFGQWGQWIFCIGLFSAAYSSFLVNSMVGGFLLSDGFNLGSDPSRRVPRCAAAAIMMIGMTIAIVVIRYGFNPVPAIILAQAITVLAAPLIGAVLWWLTSSADVMGDKRNGPLTHFVAGVGVVVLLALSIHLLFNSLIPKVNRLRGEPEAVAGQVKVVRSDQ